jgi:hypothetical protein
VGELQVAQADDIVVAGAEKPAQASRASAIRFWFLLLHFHSPLCIVVDTARRRQSCSPAVSMAFGPCCVAQALIILCAWKFSAHAPQRRARKLLILRSAPSGAARGEGAAGLIG